MKIKKFDNTCAIAHVWY